jgi:hypothetical protein
MKSKNQNIGITVATMYATMYGQPLKSKTETDQFFRNRIAEYLRDHHNMILEGQDVLDNKHTPSKINQRGNSLNGL